MFGFYIFSFFLFLPAIPQIFQEPTLLFSRAELPLVCDTIPMLHDVEVALGLVRDHSSLPNVIRVAAHAALMLAEKYHSFNDKCEVYCIAVGELCMSIYNWKHQAYFVFLK